MAAGPSSNPGRATRAWGLAAAWAAAWAAVALAPSARGQADPPATASSAPQQGPGLPAVEAKIAQLADREEGGELGQETRLQLDLYRQARASLIDAQEARKRRAGFEAAAAQVPSQMESVTAELAEPPAEIKPEPPAGATLAQLTEGLAVAQAELDAALDTLRKIEDEGQQRASRRDRVGEELAAAEKALGDAQLALAALPLPEEPVALTDARRAKIEAELSLIDQRIGALKAERSAAEATRDLLPLRQELWTRKTNQLTKSVGAWQGLVDKAHAADIERQRREAAQAAALAHPLVAPIAEVNVDLARRRDELRPRIEEAKRELREVRPNPDGLRREIESLRQKVELVGMTSTVGLMLRKSRAALPDVATHRRNISLRQAEMAAAEFERLSIDDQYQELVDGWEGQVEDLLARLGPGVPEADRAAIEQELRGQLRAERDYLRSLGEDLSAYFDALQDLNAKERQVVELTGQIDDFISERILWIRSAQPLSLGDVRAAPSAFAWLVSPQQWRMIWLGATDRAGWAWILVLAAGAALLVAIRGRLLARIQAIAREITRPGTNTIGRTVLVAIYSLLRAVVLPVLLWSAGTWLLTTDAGTMELQRAVGNACRRSALVLLVLLVLTEICRPQGLAEAHFGWQPANLRTTRRQLRWLAGVLLPLIFVSATFHRQFNDTYDASLGRLAYIGAMLVLAVFARQMLRRRRGVTETFLSRRRGGWLERLRFIWYPLAVLAPVILAAASFIGYHYTAVELTRQFAQSAGFIVLVVIVHGLLLRWLFVERQRLALAEARKRRAAYEEKRARGEEAGDAPPAEERAIDLSAVSAQSRQLLRGFMVFALFVGLWLIWAETFPAVGFLRGVELWRGSAVTAAAAGAEAVYSMITLEDLLVAVIVFIVTLIVARNIPGLLEISLLQRLPLERGAQYAISTIIRYAITIVGIVAALSIIGLTWSNVQWIAAAITVGLGFGLQEIFANFISGLIILFERPIRVGDTVSVGDVHGTVGSIRIRSTTVIDWDRKEIVIPNKQFVTGMIVNWTLSDPILRLVIPVGIAYGSDTALAEKLLLQSARENAMVLNDPPPSVVFNSFGDSSLEFHLRVFIPHVDQMLRIRHMLHSSIDQAFRKAGVEIAFPQRDIHIKTVSEGDAQSLVRTIQEPHVR